MSPDQSIVINVSGRGDKDVDSVCDSIGKYVAKSHTFNTTLDLVYMCVIGKYWAHSPYLPISTPRFVWIVFVCVDIRVSTVFPVWYSVLDMDATDAL